MDVDFGEQPVLTIRRGEYDWAGALDLYAGASPNLTEPRTLESSSVKNSCRSVM
jgi:hypothetical protein